MVNICVLGEGKNSFLEGGGMFSFSRYMYVDLRCYSRINTINYVCPCNIIFLRSKRPGRRAIVLYKTFQITFFFLRTYRFRFFKLKIKLNIISTRITKTYCAIVYSIVCHGRSIYICIHSHCQCA